MGRGTARSRSLCSRAAPGSATGVKPDLFWAGKEKLSSAPGERGSLGGQRRLGRGGRTGLHGPARAGAGGAPTRVLRWMNRVRARGSLPPARASAGRGAAATGARPRWGVRGGLLEGSLPLAPSERRHRRGAVAAAGLPPSPPPVATPAAAAGKAARLGEQKAAAAGRGDGGRRQRGGGAGSHMGGQQSPRAGGALDGAGVPPS